MNRNILILAVAAAALILGLSSMFVVSPVEQVIVTQFGEPRRVVQQPGLNFKIPVLQTVVSFDKRILDFDADVQEIPTVDQKQLRVDAFARYRIVDPLKFYQSVRTESSLSPQLASAINTELRNVLGGIELSKILTDQRSSLMQSITKQVDTRTANLGIQVVDVRIKRADLPEGNSEAIFQRMKSQREQEARKIRAEGTRDATIMRAEADKKVRVIIAEAQKRAQVTRGEGEATGEQIYRDAYGRDPQFFNFHRSVQALKSALASGTTTYIGPPGVDLFQLFTSQASPKALPQPGQSLGQAQGQGQKLK